MSEEYVANVIRTLTTKYNPSNVYLMGHSQGAWMTFNTGLNYPKLFDGLIAFGGWVDTVRIDAKHRSAKAKITGVDRARQEGQDVLYDWATNRATA